MKVKAKDQGGAAEGSAIGHLMETFEQLREYLQSRQIYRTMSEQARAQRNVSGVSEEEEKYNARGGS